MLTLGIENWIRRDAARARRRRVGLLSHEAAVDARGASTLRLLLRAGVRPAVLFGPEHGFRGTAGAGEPVASGLHSRPRIPIRSLYGETTRPRPEWLADLDMLLIDLQDLGVRCYTYLSTLCETLAAAAGTKLEVVVADRPVPLPNRCDGPMLDPAFESFVGRVRTPLLTGMTQGESARWFVRSQGLDVDLRVAEMTGYRRGARRGSGWPAWRPPSPAIRSWACATAYPATVWTEALPALDACRGGQQAFRVLGAPEVHAGRWIRDLRRADCPGIEFRTARFLSRRRIWTGARLVVTDPDAFAPVETAAHLLASLERRLDTGSLWSRAGTRPDLFDRLAGTDAFRRDLIAGTPVERIAAGWRRDRADYESQRDGALLYSRNASRAVSGASRTRRTPPARSRRRR